MVEDRQGIQSSIPGIQTNSLDRRASERASSETSQPSLPQITLPKGGGAIHGIDEKLTVDQPTGSGRLMVPVFTSPARSGGAPQLALAYDSGAGNGPFGMGWSLGIPSIARKTSKGLPRYDDAVDSDVFVLAGAEDLVPLLKQSGSGWVPDRFDTTTGGATYSVRRYRPRVEAGFARIERWENAGSGEVHWRTVNKDNVTSLYGREPASRIADPEDPTRIFTWLLDLTFDDRGNVIVYKYKAEDTGNAPPVASEHGRTVTANRYLKRVLYGNRTPYTGDGALPADWCFEVVLDYGEHDPGAPEPSETAAWPCRPDPFSTYRPGFELRTYRRCQRVLMFHHFPDELGAEAVLVRSTDLEYAPAPADPRLPAYSLLTSVVQTGWMRSAAGGAYETAQLPPLELTYAPLAIDDTLRAADPDSLVNLPGDVDGFRRRWIDLTGEGLQGLLAEDGGAWYYKHNISAWNPSGDGSAARFAPLELVATKPTLTPRDAGLQLTSLNGDGRLAAVSFAPPVAGWFELSADGKWEPLRPLAATANVDWADPNLRFVDLDGDGLADVLITEDEALTWHRWVVDSGFAEADRIPKPFDEDRGPALVFADRLGSVLLADMSGDGLADLVRVRNGEVCYWPNLGYGRFGKKITMDGAPVFDAPDQFDARRMRVADIDGSGTADLVYLGPEAATIWFNQAGGSFTQARPMPQFPPVDDVATASVFDLLGTGTASLVWTSPLPGAAGAPLRYIDITGSIKPYLLTGVANNLGASTTLRYAPSTRFYLEDRAAGTPWITRLPFPVHVVERIETADAVSRTRFVSSYSYHHGFYDPAEREFRGFARVEQLDAEAVPKESGSGVFTETPPVAGDEFTLPPACIRTWYHTGAFFDRADIARHLAAEYDASDSQAPNLGETILPSDASAEELREACRALRGRPLRQETYAQDGTPRGPYPYAVTEHRYQVDRLQAAAGGSYGAFFAWETESVTCHYERNPADPRVTHQMTLAIDEYGHVTRSASVGYPRRTPAFSQQSETHVTYTEADLVNVPDRPDWYRLGLPVEARGYELTGVAPAHPDALFDRAALLAAAEGAATLEYEETPSGAGPQRRLLKAQRTIYRQDDLSGALPRGQADSLALIDRTYTLTYTPGLLQGLFVAGGRITAPQLAAAVTGAGGFVDLDGDGHYWAPSPRTLYSPDPSHPDAVFARGHFYLPHGATDPFGNSSTVAYDAHNLLLRQTVDALGNTTTAQHNYRILQPWLATDANLNRAGVRFDALGMVIATAAMGKLTAGGGDEGDHLDTSTAEPAPSDDPTTTLEYDLDAYSVWAADPAHDPDHPAPVWVHTRARVRHRDPATPWVETYTYTDGHGRVALTKIQAEAGDAPQRDGSGRLVRDAHGGLVIAHTDTRWVGSGRVVYDNKGNPVKSYEPFFDSSPVYDDETDLVEWGVTAITRYDPLSRAIHVDNPNGTFRTVEFDPWRQVASDENDTVLTSEWYAARSGGGLGADEQDAAAKAHDHSQTPAIADLDTLGRIFHTVADNGPVGRYETTLTLDIEGQTRVTTDPLGRAVLTSDYSPGGHELHRSSVDAGDRWFLSDAAGAHLLSWDSRSHRIRSEYDELRRPTGQYVTTGGASERLAEETVYGETLPLATAQGLNLRGAAYQHHDEAGVASTDRRDFKGNVLSAGRRLFRSYRDDVDWAAAPALDATTYTTTTTYDALNRAVTTTTPDGSVTTSTYNPRGLIAGVTVSQGGAPTAIAHAIEYDAKGQRLSLAYGNGATTVYTYDPETFRLTRLQTTRPAAPNPLQDLTYTYDPAGNVTRIADAAQPTIFFDNAVVSPNADYTYDAVYRLIRATGREQIGQAAQPQTGWDDTPRRVIPLPADGQAMRGYVETYAYDPAGNISQVAHAAGAGSWTRTYAYDEPNAPPRTNHLTSTTVGGHTERYTYDAHGNIISMPHLSLMEWDWKDQLQATAQQLVNGGNPPTTYYRYHGSGQRVRKVTDSGTGMRVSERVYLGTYEIYREYAPGGAVTLERSTLHIGGGAQRICLIETTSGSEAGDAAGTLFRYQLTNLLGSAVLELDGGAAIVSYEEYYPYGSTAFQSGRSVAEGSLKRYRFTGKERDGETGFYYHGARYYVPWLGRWLRPDPRGLVDGPGVYSYCRDNPVILHDPSGTQGTSQQHEPDDVPPHHFEEVPQNVGGPPRPGLRLVVDRPVFRPLFSLDLPPPPVVPAPQPPPPPPTDPQPINPIQSFQPAPTSDPGKVNIATSLGYSTAGTGTSFLSYALAVGLLKHDPWTLEAVAGVGGTGDPSLTLAQGALSAGLHGTLNPSDTRSNWTGYLSLTQTFGQNPPGSSGANLGGALTLGYEYHFGDQSHDNDRPTVVTGANVSGAVGQYAAISPLGATGASLPTANLSSALGVGAVGNVSLNLDYYSQSGAPHGLSKIPRVTLLGEGFVSYATGASPVTLPGGMPSPTGSSLAVGANIGGLYNFRIDHGRSVLSIGATFGPRWQWDTVGTSTVPASGWYGGFTAGAAF